MLLYSVFVLCHLNILFCISTHLVAFYIFPLLAFELSQTFTKKANSLEMLNLIKEAFHSGWASCVFFSLI